MLHIPILRQGNPYTSLDVAMSELEHARDVETRVLIARAQKRYV